MIPRHAVHRLIRFALAEDIGPGDVTTASVFTGQETGTALAVAKAERERVAEWFDFTLTDVTGRDIRALPDPPWAQEAP